MIQPERPRHEEIGQQILEIPEGMSEAARALAEAELYCPVEVSEDQSLRIKILDACGMACTFCHNEGTPVAADNRSREAGDFVAAGRSDRVSIYLNDNGADFVTAPMHPDEQFKSEIDRLRDHVPFDEVHLTGGEPTLHPNLTGLVGMLAENDMTVKITSNGERFYKLAEDLREAGLSKVVFSIFGTTPEELAAVQGAKYRNPAFAAKKLDALERSIVAAHETGISAGANIVMPNSEHSERVKRVIERFGDLCHVRILNSLEDGNVSNAAIYELLAELEAQPKLVKMTAGASGMRTEYELPDGKKLTFKQIRRSYLGGA